LRGALRRELLFREQQDRASWAPLSKEGPGASKGPSGRQPLSADEVRIHAWLNKRLAWLHYQRHGLWPRLRRFLFGNRLLRWLGLGSKKALSGIN
jgi:hypothetical protein